MQKRHIAMTIQLSVVTDAISGYVMLARSILLGTTQYNFSVGLMLEDLIHLD